MVDKQLIRDVEHKAYFANDEICVVALTRPGAAPPDYESVMNTVNGEIARRLTEIDATARFPTLLRSIGGGSVLIPLLREMLPGTKMKEPVVGFTRKERGTTRLHFYSISLPNLESRLDEYARGIEKARSIRSLVELLNTPPITDDTSDFVVTPNWLSNAADGPGVGGGPGTEPELPDDVRSDTPEDQRFHFRGELEELVMAQREEAARQAKQAVPVEVTVRGAKVVVAVLDTCPAPTAPDNAVARISQGGYENELLMEVVGMTAAGTVPRVTIDASIAVDPNYFSGVVGSYAPDWPGHTPSPGAAGTGRFDIVDHGLFAAGIIKDICPTADIHLIRVLDQCGVGDLFALAQTLVMLPQHFLADSSADKRLIINLSLMLALPPEAELNVIWPTRPANLDLGLAEIIDWLEEQGEGKILVVAAAGNDGLVFSTPPEPRYPARFDSVLSVAALDALGNPSNFSNEGDDSPSTPNGVATFGGRALIAEKAGRGRVVTKGGRTVRQLGSDDVEGIKVATTGNKPDAVLGIFGAKQSSFTGNANKTGWGWWGGTSFATPIISGIAAVLWQDDPSLFARDVIDRIVQGPYNGSWQPTLKCSTIDAYQEGKAYWYR